MSRSTISTFKLFELFPNEASARKYLEGRLWPNGVTCPECGSGARITTRKDGYYRCNACRIDFTWRTGNVFERSHIPSQKVAAILNAFGNDPDISPRALATEVQVTDKTACLLLQDLREAAGDAFISRLTLDDPHYRLVAGFRAYRVGDDGSIWTRWARSKKPRLGWTWKPLKTFVNARRGSYRSCLLYDESRNQKQARVSRLVCEAFHGPCPPGLECCHRDDNPLNDAASNLYWGTHQENMRQAKERGRLPGGSAFGERNSHAKLTDAQLDEVIALKGQLARRHVAARYGISPTRVSQIWAGKRITYAELTQ